ncbi:uncharacterized protein ALTATR162_LOCUS5740 [Alternaria atra]|uniref:J domain-containing protein n=1 Tax=Alternaria atra TaxID=119953 RepID=A0A8J2I1A2_9PLEO|nr:uncharacterized protein ALTATR162_LOCUS5740 [Alternaria atra]CAG5160109.1 unnamed protein product [Alternaria atra]
MLARRREFLSPNQKRQPLLLPTPRQNTVLEFHPPAYELINAGLNRTSNTSNAYFFRALGLSTTAIEATVWARFKLLPLVHHPDKADPGRKNEVTDRFCEIQHAYEYRMSHLDPNAYDVAKREDDEGWDGELPTGIFNANSAWWNELKGIGPTPVIEWAAAC